MKVLKKIIMPLLVAFVMLFAGITAGAEEIGSPQDGFVAQETVSPHETVPPKNDLFQLDSKGYALFYTQTTIFALIAGYLILFKVKGIPKHEKMHKIR